MMIRVDQLRSRPLAIAPATCSPTSAAVAARGADRHPSVVLTGRYRGKFGFEANDVAGYQPVHGLQADHRALADAFGSQGCATSTLGEWHLGFWVECRSRRRGFDENFGFLGGLHLNMSGKPPTPQADHCIRRDDERADEDAIARAAVSFIDGHKGGPSMSYRQMSVVPNRSLCPVVSPPAPGRQTGNP